MWGKASEIDREGVPRLWASAGCLKRRRQGEYWWAAECTERRLSPPSNLGEQHPTDSPFDLLHLCPCHLHFGSGAQIPLNGGAVQFCSVRHNGVSSRCMSAPTHCSSWSAMEKMNGGIYITVGNTLESPIKSHYCVFSSFLYWRLPQSTGITHQCLRVNRYCMSFSSM